MIHSLCVTLKTTGRTFPNLSTVVNGGRTQCYSKDYNVMSKFMNKGNRKRSAWYTTPERPSSLPLPASIARGPQSNKRIVVLNKMFMKHITDLMSTGEEANQISGLGIEITKVKVGAEFNVVNVYWIATGNSTEDKVQTILRNTSRYLRQELNNLRVMGKVPEIQFVRDRTVASWAAVEAILATADFGEDYQPSGINSFKSDFGNEACPENQVSEENIDHDLPPMRQNVLGLNRGEIIERLRTAMKGKQSLTPRTHKLSSELAQYEPFDEEAFSQFLLQRKIMKDRIIKESRREPKLDVSDDYDDYRSQILDEEEDYMDEDDER